MDINLILEGGGALGVSYIGAYKALSDEGYNIKMCAGTSIGSLMGSLIIAGYTPSEIENIFYGDEFDSFLRTSGLGKKIPPYKALNVFLEKGVYNTSVIEKFVDTLLRRKGVVTFDDVIKRGKNRLTVIGADVTNRRLIVMPHDLKDYGIDPKEFKVAKAVSISCAMPLLFTPTILNYKGIESYIVDGGLLSNFPVWVFDVENENRNMTYAIKIDERPSNTSQGKTDIFAYIVDVFNTPFNDDRVVYVRDKEKLQVIGIENDKFIRSTEFYKIKEFRSQLYDLGYRSVKSYFEKNKGR